jgi:hypothetical protein
MASSPTLLIVYQHITQGIYNRVICKYTDTWTNNLLSRVERIRKRCDLDFESDRWGPLATGGRIPSKSSYGLVRWFCKRVPDVYHFSFITLTFLNNELQELSVFINLRSELLKIR